MAINIDAVGLRALFAECRAQGVTRIRVTQDSVEAEFGGGGPEKARPVVDEPTSALDLAMNAPDVIPRREPE